MAGEFTVGPGMVTSQMSGGSLGMTDADKRRMWELEDRKKAEREQRNAEIRAQQAAQQQTARDAADREKVRAAFNATYGPQIQRAYQDTAVQSAPTNTPAGMARDLAIQHGFQYGGMVGQPGNMPGGKVGQSGSDIINFAKGKLPQPEMRPDQIQNTLNYMWSQQTDPYQLAAGKMGGMMRMFHPSDEPAKAWGRSRAGFEHRLKKKKSNEEEEF